MGMYLEPLGGRVIAWAAVSAYMQRGWRLFSVEVPVRSSGVTRAWVWKWELQRCDPSTGTVLERRAVQTKTAELMRQKGRLAMVEDPGALYTEWTLVDRPRRSAKEPTA